MPVFLFAGVCYNDKTAYKWTAPIKNAIERLIMIRLAKETDIPGVVTIFNKILELEARGEVCTGWKKGIYPTEQTALDALSKEELFVLEENNRILAAARINQEQVPVYALCRWKYAAPDSEVMVIHTLVVDPDASGCGIGSKYVRFYEDFALQHGCRYLRMDTNQINERARALYKNLGYSEQGIVPCVFNGIDGVQLVCLEKRLG